MCTNSMYYQKLLSAKSIHSFILCHMNSVHKTDSVVPSDSTLTLSHRGHTAVTHGMMRVSSEWIWGISLPEETRTEA
jgi:hypothetical protein